MHPRLAHAAMSRRLGGRLLPSPLWSVCGRTRADGGRPSRRAPRPCSGVDRRDGWRPRCDRACGRAPTSGRRCPRRTQRGGRWCLGGRPVAAVAVGLLCRPPGLAFSRFVPDAVIEVVDPTKMLDAALTWAGVAPAAGQTPARDAAALRPRRRRHRAAGGAEGRKETLARFGLRRPEEDAPLSPRRGPARGLSAPPCAGGGRGLAAQLPGGAAGTG